MELLRKSTEIIVDEFSVTTNDELFDDSLSIGLGLCCFHLGACCNITG